VSPNLLITLLVRLTLDRGREYVLRLWPAVVNVCIRHGVGLDAVTDPRVLLIVDHIRRAASAPHEQAAPPSDALLALVLAAALSSATPVDLRSLAAGVLLEVAAVQRSEVIAPMRMSQIVFVGPTSMLIYRHHKTQNATDKAAGHLEPTPVFPAARARAAIESLIRDGLLRLGSNQSLLSRTDATPSVDRYRDALPRLWAYLGLPPDATAQCKSHGLRRKGAAEFLAAGGTIEDLFALAPWASMRSAAPYLPASWVTRMGFPRSLGRARGPVADGLG
jgi:hypothetical protein